MQDSLGSPANPLEAITLEALRQRCSMKWRAHPPDVLPLWVAEMDVPLAAPIAAAVKRALALGDTGYAYGAEYAEALAEFAALRWGWDGLAVNRTLLMPDVMAGIVEVLRVITHPGDRVVVNSPVFPPFYSFVEHLGRRIVEAPLDAQDRIDLASLERALDGAGVYLLCNPHNPTGTVHTRAELERVAQLAQAAGVRVVADEIHAPLVLSGATFTPFLSVSAAASGFSLMSASKAWNLAGLKAAVAVAGEAAADDLARVPDEVSHAPSHLGALAHTAAVREGGPWLDSLLAGLAENRDRLERLLAERLPAIRWRRPEATYLAWLDCTSLNLPAVSSTRSQGDVSFVSGPAAAFLGRGRIALSSGDAFGTGGAGHVRLNFATSQRVLEEAVDRMASSIP